MANSYTWDIHPNEDKGCKWITVKKIGQQYTYGSCCDQHLVEYLQWQIAEDVDKEPG